MRATFYAILQVVEDMPRQGKTITVNSVVEESGFAHNVCNYALLEFIRKGLLTRERRGKGFVYCVGQPLISMKEDALTLINRLTPNRE